MQFREFSLAQVEECGLELGQTKRESINLVVSRVEKKKMMKVSGWANESGQETTAFRGGRVPLGMPCSLQGKGST